VFTIFLTRRQILSRADQMKPVQKTPFSFILTQIVRSHLCLRNQM